MHLEAHEIDTIITTEIALDDLKPGQVIDIWLATDSDIERIKGGLITRLGRKTVRQKIRFGYYRDICH